MGQLIRDLQYASRGLMRSPMFTAVALLSIALGIGANTAIFTLVDEVLLRVLPVKNPEQLVLFNGARDHYGSNSGGNMLSYPMYEDFRDNFVDGAPPLPRISQAVTHPAPTPKVFSGLFARRPVAMNVSMPDGGGQTERVKAQPPAAPVSPSTHLMRSPQRSLLPLPISPKETLPPAVRQ